MDIQQYIFEKYDGNPEWFVEECNSVANRQRVNEILDIKDYLSGVHAILERPNEMFNGKEFESRRIILQYAKTILNFQSSYLLQKPITLTGNEYIVKEFKNVYRKGKYNRIDFDILDKLTKYGNAYEYVYIDENKDIKSKIIMPEDSYPVYDHENKMIAFIEYYNVDNINYYSVYYEDRVEKYDNKGGQLRLSGVFENLSGLPIVYVNQNELDPCFGRSDLKDIISILDSMEDLISRATDAYYRFITGIPVITGQQLKGDGLPVNIIGGGLVLDDGATFDFVSNKFDYQAFESIYKTLTSALLDIANIPAVSMSKTDISNLSEVSIKLLFSLSDMKAGLNEKYMRAGMEQRFEKIRKLLELKGITFSDEEFDSLDVVFQYSRPQNEKDIIDNLKTLNDMRAISLETILENNPYVSDVSQELMRLKENQVGNDMGNNTDEEDMKSDDSGDDFGK
jgi:SPP1 family phage portal protein